MVQIPSKSLSSLHLKRGNVTLLLYLIKKYPVYLNSYKLLHSWDELQRLYSLSSFLDEYMYYKAE